METCENRTSELNLTSPHFHEISKSEQYNFKDFESIPGTVLSHMHHDAWVEKVHQSTKPYKELQSPTVKSNQALPDLSKNLPLVTPLPFLAELRARRRSEAPETRLKEPETRQKEPETRQKAPETRQKAPETRLKEPETRQKAPETRQKEPYTRQKEPETGHKEPEIEQKELVAPENKQIESEKAETRQNYLYSRNNCEDPSFSQKVRFGMENPSLNEVPRGSSSSR